MDTINTKNFRRMKKALFLSLSFSILPVHALESYKLFSPQLSPSSNPNPNSNSSLVARSNLDDAFSPSHPFSAFSNIAEKRPEDCPPCFNCMLPAFNCMQYGKCSEYDGQCKCPEGFGGQDCSQPLCGSLADGSSRYPRKGDSCECSEGWGGLTCNVCQNNAACETLMPDFPTIPNSLNDPSHSRFSNLRSSSSNSSSKSKSSPPTSIDSFMDSIRSPPPSNKILEDDDKPDDGGKSGNGKDRLDEPICYKGGYAVKQVHQMCDVTNRKILDQLAGKIPQVTFTCDVPSETCGFQFWIDRIESFYCGFTNCSREVVGRKGEIEDGNGGVGGKVRTKSWLERVGKNDVLGEGKDDDNDEDDEGLEEGWVGSGDEEVKYSCEELRCECVPGRMLCGENGSVDIGEFLTESIRGPATFTTRHSKAKFEEDAMNQLINDIFGDQYITLNCKGGECLPRALVPGLKKGGKGHGEPDSTVLVGVSAAAAAVIFVAACLLFWYLGRDRNDFADGGIRLPAEENSKLLSSHVPASLHFSNLSYSIPSRPEPVLDSVSGRVRPGQIMAIMGASGAGKSTLLDILARKEKRGEVKGDVLVNGRKIEDGGKFRKLVGFVDQEDTLMGTLTVYETVLYSALLRLPRGMSFEAKKIRTLETMHELGILGIRDSRIGETGRRAISGGEKRRVSIACELVTSPSILYLDEPTSGLDSFNALNVIESLVTLARSYQRTVVFTIHQPRSNIVALFDQLVLLANGKVVFSGEYRKCQEYFDRIGWPCPAGFNIADYLIDLIAQKEKSAPQPDLNDAVASHVPLGQVLGDEDAAPIGDEELGLGNRRSGPSSPPNGQGTSRPSSTTAAEQGDETELRTRPSSAVDDDPSRDDSHKKGSGKGLLGGVGFFKKLAHHLPSTGKTPVVGGGRGETAEELNQRLNDLVRAYEESEINGEIQEEIGSFRGLTTRHSRVSTDSTRFSGDGGNGEAHSAHSTGSNLEDMRDVEAESPWVGRSGKRFRRASLWTQFMILSGRAFKNLYRNPMLMLTHYGISILIALVCSALFHNITNDIPGYQNRMGLFFFIQALFGFSCLTSLNTFSKERVLFMRERANGYYSPFTYFTAKILFDLLPLRIVPPLILGAIIYSPVGLVRAVAEFWKFILILVLFNLVCSSAVMCIGIAIENEGVAGLVGSLTMLYNLLFAGLLINKDKLAPGLRWLQSLSFFHAALEALLVNELRWLQLIDHRYGVDIEVPGATILSMFGFDAQAFWWPDTIALVIFFAGFTLLSFIALVVFVKERR